MLLRTGKVYQLRETERHLNQCQTMKEVKEYILGMCLAYQEEVKETSIYSSVIRAVMKYVSAHCSHPTWISERLPIMCICPLPIWVFYLNRRRGPR